MTHHWDPMRPVHLCECCKPDENGNPVPDPSCPICGGEGVTNIIETQPSGEVGDAFEHYGLQNSKNR